MSSVLVVVAAVVLAVAPRLLLGTTPASAPAAAKASTPLPPRAIDAALPTRNRRAQVVEPVAGETAAIRRAAGRGSRRRDAGADRRRVRDVDAPG